LAVLTIALDADAIARDRREEHENCKADSRLTAAGGIGDGRRWAGPASGPRRNPQRRTTMRRL